jgi:hypothetical protein
MDRYFAQTLLGLALLLAPGRSESCAGEVQPRLFHDLVQRYPVGDPQADNPLRETEGPKALAAGDLNQDGRADIICGNLDGSISVLLGLPEGALSEQIIHPATGILSNSSLREVIVTDLNGDSLLDVAVADVASQGVLVLLGNGDGTLHALQRIPVGPARALDAGDLNGDGTVDLVVANSPAACFNCPPPTPAEITNRSVRLLFGNGDGTFRTPEDLLGPVADAFFYDVAVADVNQDGLLDILVLNQCTWLDPTGKRYVSKGQILILANGGGGSFHRDAPDQILQGTGEGPRSFTLGYLDERLAAGQNPPPGATLDLVVANRDSSTLDVFRNQGGLCFSSPVSVPAGDSPRDVAVADLDGNGWTDLVVVNRNANTLSVLLGFGGGQFSGPAMELPAGVSPRNIVLADVNGDGVLDAAVNNRVSEDISLFLGAPGLAGFLLPEGYYPAGFSPISVVAKDFNRDGYPDVASANLRSHDVWVRLNLGDGTFGPESTYPVNYAPVFLATDDVNGDGYADLIVSCLGSAQAIGTNGRSSLVTLLGTGTGQFQTPRVTPIGDAQFKTFWLRLGDLSGDGILDAAVSGANGALILLEGTGDGTFRPTGKVESWVDGRPLGLALGDFDRNGWLDIATSRGMVFLNDGQFFSPTNDQTTVRTKQFSSGAQAWAVETEDLDGDGFLDLMVALTFRRPDPIGVLFGQGDGSFTAPDVYEGPDVGAVALWGTDMDGDGIKDIVIGNRCAATVIIMQGQAARQFRIREIVRTYSVEDVAVADLNQDGKPDLVGVGIGLWPVLNGVTNTLSSPRQAHLSYLPDREGPFINELMALNQTFHVINGCTPDWIEIYNHSPTAQNLAGWALAQLTGDGNTNRWFFPGDATIAPWGHLVVYCRKTAVSPDLFASFELSADGENLLLFDPAGTVIDQLQFPALPADVSYARFLDGARFFVYNPAPTLGSANLKPANLQPSIEKKDPYVGPGGTVLGLTARAFDDLAVAYAAVCYRLAEPPNQPFIELLLNDDGLSGDKRAGDGYYGALLPSLPAGVGVEYYLRVVDLEGQVDNSPDDPDEVDKLHRLPVPAPYPALRLSELVADNAAGLKDEMGECEDWIEVVNVGPTWASLDGLALLKDYFEPQNAWPFPSGLWLKPGKRLLVFCDDDLRQGPLHASFKLQRDGDRVFLVQTNEPRAIIDSLSFNSLPTDTSFGVLGDGVLAQMLAWPTPAEPNLPIPPQTTHPEPAVDPFCHWFQPGPGGLDTFALRWLGNAQATYEVHWSEDLAHWNVDLTTPIHLGEGLFQWLDPGPPPPHPLLPRPGPLSFCWEFCPAYPNGQDTQQNYHGCKPSRVSPSRVIVVL